MFPMLYFVIGLTLLGLEIDRNIDPNQTNWYVPSSVVSQTAGYVGFTSLGVGYNVGEHYEANLLIGYTPSFIGGEDIWSSTWKNTLHTYTFDLNKAKITPYVGLGIIVSHDEDTFIFLPRKYPRGYYPASGLFTSPYIGLQIRQNSHALYTEVASLDYYLEAKVRNPEYLKWQDVTTFGIGYKYYLEE